MTPKLSARLLLVCMSFSVRLTAVRIISLQLPTKIASLPQDERSGTFRVLRNTLFPSETGSSAWSVSAKLKEDSPSAQLKKEVQPLVLLVAAKAQEAPVVAAKKPLTTVVEKITKEQAQAKPKPDFFDRFLQFSETYLKFPTFGAKRFKRNMKKGHFVLVQSSAAKGS